MTLWGLLLALCFGMPVGGALASPGLARAGLRGYVAAIAGGLVLGTCCAWTMEAVGATVRRRIEKQPVSLRERYYRALYFVAMLWIMLAGLLGKWVSSVMLRHVF